MFVLLYTYYTANNTTTTHRLGASNRGGNTAWTWSTGGSVTYYEWSTGAAQPQRPSCAKLTYTINSQSGAAYVKSG